jgi:hypothetical protein
MRRNRRAIILPCPAPPREEGTSHGGRKSAEKDPITPVNACCRCRKQKVNIQVQTASYECVLSRKLRLDMCCQSVAVCERCFVTSTTSSDWVIAFPQTFERHYVFCAYSDQFFSLSDCCNSYAADAISQSAKDVKISQQFATVHHQKTANSSAPNACKMQRLELDTSLRAQASRIRGYSVDFPCTKLQYPEI